MKLDHAILLCRVLSGPAYGPAVVLSAKNESPEENMARYTYALERCKRVIPAQGANTYEEAVAAVAQVRAGHLTIVTSAYHQLRAFLTFVAACGDQTIHLWNLPMPSAWEKFSGELEKIALYQHKGHVASWEAGLHHLDTRDRIWSLPYAGRV